VKIVKARVETVGDKDAKKVICEVLHPDIGDTIQISSAKVEKNGKLVVGGLWFNLDEDNKIRKGSHLALFLNVMGAKNVKELEGKSCRTIEDETGYLVFKGY
jgi:hypothetical protein